MLMIVPLMIWSARTLMRSQAWRAETTMPVAHGREQTDEEGRRGPEDGRFGSAGNAWTTSEATNQPRERAGEHHALDADVDDARALVHDAAERAEGEWAWRAPG